MARPSLESPLSPKSTIKFLCSYGGKIVPRYPDCKLRYYGGHTRVLAVHNSISFSELMSKMEELCGTSSVSIKCQLPTEDLDALVTLKSDEDLANLLQEYHQLSLISSTTMKVRAFLSPTHTSSKSTTSVSSSFSSSSSSSSLKSISPKSLSPSSSFSGAGYVSPRLLMQQKQVNMVAYPKAMCYATMRNASGGNCVNCCNSRQVYVVHNGNYWR